VAVQTVRRPVRLAGMSWNRLSATYRWAKSNTPRVPVEFAEGTPLADSEFISLGTYRALVGAGHRLISAEEFVRARMPTKDEAKTLHLDLVSPVLAIERITRDTTAPTRAA
jgi:hypothetical protein